MPRLEITVTAEDIARGQRGDATSCPIALAVRRLFGADAYYVEAFEDHLSLEPLETADDVVSVSLPWQAEALAFEVVVPDELLEAVHIPPPVAPGQVEAGLA